VPIPEERASCYGSFRPADEVFAAWKLTLKSAQALEARLIVKARLRFPQPSRASIIYAASFAPSQMKDAVSSWLGAARRVAR